MRGCGTYPRARPPPLTAPPPRRRCEFLENLRWDIINELFKESTELRRLAYAGAKRLSDGKVDIKTEHYDLRAMAAATAAEEHAAEPLFFDDDVQPAAADDEELEGGGAAAAAAGPKKKKPRC